MAAAAQNAAKLLAHPRETATSVVHVQHVMPSATAPFFHPSIPGSEIHANVGATADYVWGAPIP